MSRRFGRNPADAWVVNTAMMNAPMTTAVESLTTTACTSRVAAPVIAWASARRFDGLPPRIALRQAPNSPAGVQLGRRSTSRPARLAPWGHP